MARHGIAAHSRLCSVGEAAESLLDATCCGVTQLDAMQRSYHDRQELRPLVKDGLHGLKDLHSLHFENPCPPCNIACRLLRVSLSPVFVSKEFADNPIICCSHQNRTVLRSIKDYRHCKSHLLNGLEKFILVGITGLHRLIQLLRSQNIEMSHTERGLRRHQCFIGHVHKRHRPQIHQGSEIRANHNIARIMPS